MFLIGQYDSPFTRRVAIAMRLYGLPFEHRPWSTFGEGDKIAPYNPLRRVPTLVLDDGEALIESTAILDYLDELVGPEKAMIAARGPARRHALKVCALATGLGDKAVSLVYERVLRKEPSKIWVDRCETQVGGVLEVLEQARDDVETPWWFGDAHRSCRHRGRLRASLCRRGASRAVSRRALSGAGGALRGLRGAAGVCRDRATAGAAERGLSAQGKWTAGRRRDGGLPQIRRVNGVRTVRPPCRRPGRPDRQCGDGERQRGGGPDAARRAALSCQGRSAVRFPEWC